MLLAQTMLFGARVGSAEFRRLDVAVEMAPGELAGYLAYWMHDVIGDASLEWLQLGDVGGRPGWVVWQLDAAAGKLMRAASLALPVEIGNGPLWACWAPEIRGRKEILFALSHDGAWALRPDPAGGAFKAERVYSGTTVLKEMTEGDGMDVKPVAFDVDGDGSAEIALPSPDSPRLLKRSADGSYVAIPLPAQAVALKDDDGSIGFHVRLWEPSAALKGRQSLLLTVIGQKTLRAFVTGFLDVNFDNRIDLVWPEKREGSPRRILVSLQGKDGSFGVPTPLRIPSFDWLPEPDLSGPLYLDGDDKPDFLAIHSAFSLDDPRTVIGIHYGRLDDSSSQEARRPPPISSRDPAGITWIGDIDGDGLDDVCASLFSYLVSSSNDLIDYFLRDEARFRIRVFYGAAGRGLPKDPDASLEVKVKISSLTPPLAPPFDLSADLNGDGKRDLLLRRSETTVQGYFLDPKTLRFETKPSVEFETPERSPVAAMDLNADGMDDLVCLTQDPLRFRIYLSQAGSK